MDIGGKIEEVFEQIKKRPMLMDKFSQLESMEEAYEFFHSVRGGYTKQEFYDYISNFLDELDELDDGDENIDIDEISMKELENIAGGAGTPKRAFASLLATMSLLPTVPAGVHASEVSADSTRIEAKLEKLPSEEVNPVKKDKEADKENKGENSVSTSEKDSASEEHPEEKKQEKKKSTFFSKLKKFIFRNKGKIAGGIIAAILGVIAYKHREDIGKNMKEIAKFFKGLFMPNKIYVDGIELDANWNNFGEADDKIEQAYNEFVGEYNKNHKDKQIKDDKKTKEKNIERIKNEYWAQRNSRKSSFWNKIPIICGIATVLPWAGARMDEVSKYFVSLRKIKESIPSIFPSITVQEYDPVSPMESNTNLNKAFKNISGQTKAKKQLRQAISSMVVDKYDKFITDQPYTKGDVFYFIGPSGVGKTFMAKQLCENEAFTKDTQYYVFSAGDIDSKSKESLVEQIFAPKFSDYYGYDSNKKTKSSLYNYITNHPNGVVIFDEYDKLPNNSLDEVFRSVMDKGKINVVGQELDCSGITFILTSNESKDSLNIRGGNKKREGSSSITHRKHDESFTNRLKIIEFEKLNDENYLGIARHDLYENLKEKYSQEDLGGIKIEMSEESLEKIAKRASSFDKGARFINIDLYGEAMSVLTELLLNTPGKKLKSFNGKTVELEYYLRDVTDEEAEYDAPEDKEGKYYVKVGDKYKRWDFRATVKD